MASRCARLMAMPKSARSTRRQRSPFRVSSLSIPMTISPTTAPSPALCRCRGRFTPRASCLPRTACALLAMRLPLSWPKAASPPVPAPKRSRSIMPNCRSSPHSMPPSPPMLRRSGRKPRAIPCSTGRSVMAPRLPPRSPARRMSPACALSRTASPRRRWKCAPRLANMMPRPRPSRCRPAARALPACAAC